MKYVRTLILTLVAAVFVFSAPVLLAQTQTSVQRTLHRATTATTPAGANLERYPLEKKQLSRDREAELGLRLVKLPAAWTGYNFHQEVEGGRWILETLPAGTLVLEDGGGNPVYKQDCGNRLVALPQCPACVTPAVASTPNVVPPPSGNPGLFERLGDLLKSAALGLWNLFGDALRALGWLLAFLIHLLLLGLLLYALSDWLDYRREQRRAQQQPGQQPPPLTQNVVAVQVPVAQQPFRRRLANVLPWRRPRNPPPPPAPLVVPPVVPLAPASGPAAPAPVPAPAAQRRFMAYMTPEQQGDPDHRLRFGGFRRVDMDHDGGVTTIRMYN